MSIIPDVTIEELIARYDTLLFDAYGVLVHSVGALPGAATVIDRLNRTGKTYYVLTNDASKLPETAAARYRGFGLDLVAARIVTSGSLLTPYFAAHRLTRARCLVLGPPDSARYVEQAGGHLVAPGEAFDVLVIGDESGFPFLETMDATLSALFSALDRDQSIRLLLPNPDAIYPSGRGFGFGAGSLAAMFEAALRARYPHRPDLRFVRLGKPEAGVFAEALRRSGTRNMVMIGDQLETDIRGARAFGLDSAFVGTGLSEESLSALPDELWPTYQLASLEMSGPRSPARPA
jgi:HAD superfamily hydrolase (TIGR01459 family)